MSQQQADWHFQIIDCSKIGNRPGETLCLAREHPSPAMGSDVWELNLAEARQLRDRLDSYLGGFDDD